MKLKIIYILIPLIITSACSSVSKNNNDKQNEIGRGECIIKSVVEMAANLKMTCICEGVETKEQLENFKKLSKLKFIKSISSTEIESISDWDNFELIIDNKGEAYGGTGKSFDWKILENVKKYLPPHSYQIWSFKEIFWINFFKLAPDYCTTLRNAVKIGV